MAAGLKTMQLRWLPNAISLLRIVLIAPILYYIVSARYDLALALFFVRFSDGWTVTLPRHSTGTPGGALLDPIADKLLVAGARWRARDWSRYGLRHS
jgi:cardiolipin synthase